MGLEKAAVAGSVKINDSKISSQPDLLDARFCKKSLKVLLVDDHAVVRQGLAANLKLNSDVEVVGEATDGLDAVEKARNLRPDVVLMDISMPNMNGIEATRIIHSEFPHIRIIGLSMYDKDAFAAAMIDAGASAYCIKGCATHVLLTEIRGGAL